MDLASMIHKAGNKGAGSHKQYREMKGPSSSVSSAEDMEDPTAMTPVEERSPRRRQRSSRLEGPVETAHSWVPSFLSNMSRRDKVLLFLSATSVAVLGAMLPRLFFGGPSTAKSASTSSSLSLFGGRTRSTMSPTSAPTPCHRWTPVVGDGDDEDGDIEGFVEDERVGSSVALSNDGATVAVGGAELVRLYRLDTSKLASSGNSAARWKLTQEASQSLGLRRVVCELSGDGHTLAIGSPVTDATPRLDGSPGNGEVRAYTNSLAFGWVPLAQTLYGTDFDPEFGTALALPVDGQRMVVGSSVGVRVYERRESDTVWTLIRHVVKIVAGVTYGANVAISGDGSRIAVGEDVSDDDQTGSVSLFDLEPYELVLQVEGSRIGDRFGKSVALSHDGKRLAVGAYYGDYVQVYEWLNDYKSWALMGHRIYGRLGEDTDSYGRKVSLSSDGTRLAVSAPSEGGGIGNYTGAVYVYEYASDNDDDYENSPRQWRILGDPIYGVDDYDYAGWSLSLSGDGNTLAVGADYHSGAQYKTGHVRIFEYSCRSDGSS